MYFLLPADRRCFSPRLLARLSSFSSSGSDFPPLPPPASSSSSSSFASRTLSSARNPRHDPPPPTTTMIKTRLKHHGASLQRLAPLRLRYLFLPALLWCLLASFFWCSRAPRFAALVPWPRQRLFGAPLDAPPVRRMPLATALDPLSPRVACFGPRDKLLSDSPDDNLHPSDLPGVGTNPVTPPEPPRPRI